MVRSIRFWVQAAGVAAPEKKESGYSLTDFGRVLLGDRGLDPFLEDSLTLWLLHWNLSTDRENPLLAWDYLLNRWHEPELARSTALKVLHKEAARVDEGISMVTLEQHFDTFLHTYVPTRGRKGQVQEDNLDCPLVELDFLLKVGERGGGKREAIYSFRREEKPEISLELFAYCLDDFWRESHESTLSLREVAHGHGSPGQVFKLPEDDVRARLDLLSRQPDGFFAYTESVQFQQVRRRKDSNKATLLKAIYKAGKDTSVDLEKAYEDASRAIDTPRHVASLIKEYLSTRPLVARRHYIETGNLRHFEVRYTAVSELPTLASLDSTDHDGVIVVPLCETLAEQEEALQFAQRSSVRAPSARATSQAQQRRVQAKKTYNSPQHYFTPILSSAK